MNCLWEVPSTKTEASAYATGDDFCRVFEERLDDLYQLSFVLTGNHEVAERCFVAGFEESIRANQVFKEWAHARAKQTIIQNAIRALRPYPSNAKPSLASSAFTKDSRVPEVSNQTFGINSVLAFDAFDRFVFVLTVLDRYTDRDCAHLLNCPVQEIREARLRAFEQIVNSYRESSSHQTAKSLQEKNR
jgi:DNA-directed RNA polymerase specialized sigma24 family protein